jgi:hypothetical protein
MKRPEDVQLSREEGEALLARLEANTLTAEDRQVLGKVLTFYFWLLFALREAKLSLKGIVKLTYGEATQSQADGLQDAHLRHPTQRAPSLSATSGSIWPSADGTLVPVTGVDPDGSGRQ